MTEAEIDKMFEDWLSLSRGRRRRYTYDVFANMFGALQAVGSDLSVWPYMRERLNKSMEGDKKDAV